MIKYVVNLFLLGFLLTGCAQHRISFTQYQSESIDFGNSEITDSNFNIDNYDTSILKRNVIDPTSIILSNLSNFTFLGKGSFLLGRYRCEGYVAEGMIDLTNSSGVYIGAVKIYALIRDEKIIGVLRSYLTDLTMNTDGYVVKSFNVFRSGIAKATYKHQNNDSSEDICLFDKDYFYEYSSPLFFW